ncbi:DUF4234 domain-containing protein [Butyrivibrio sp. VCB2006]|uniref:DUF4234 domain-containing protein n=1 Tax=Butyrivibrio sp. VCB2006 TaxID=1280679 RepID=UPI00041AC519|nr:DUF4234 domain-containing protein [Butyrivibrio sp. VCB2006]
MFCPNCGTEVTEGTKFCPNCGADIQATIEAGAAANMNATNQQPQMQSQPTGFDYNSYQQNTQQGNPQQGFAQQGAPYYLNIAGIQKRDLAIAIILSIVTCGIYGIYWFIVLTDETNQITGKTDLASGGLAFLFSIISCGIYYFYWSYKMGEKVDMIKGNPNGSTSILFLILSIFGLGIVNYIIAQDAINNLVSAC